MAEDTPYIPPGAEDEESDVLGKLDELINRHKPKPRDPAIEPVPILIDALPEDDTRGIPTLTDIVSRPDTPPPDAGAQSGVEGALVQRLAMRLEVERARLLGAAGGNPARTEILDELIERLRESLPDIVRVTFSREERKSRPEDENR
jgi:hypothetical protein